MTFADLKNGDIFYVGAAKDTLWMKVGDGAACRVFRQDGKLKVTVSALEERQFLAPGMAVGKVE